MNKISFLCKLWICFLFVTTSLFAQNCTITAYFAAPDSICVGDTILFENQSIGNPTYFYWSINNNYISSDFHLVESFWQAGDYHVELLAISEGADSCLAVYDTTIIVDGCGQEIDCAIQNVNISASPCDASGHVVLDIFATNSSASHTSYYVTDTDGTYYGSFTYGTNQTLGSVSGNQSTYTFILEDGIDSTCQVMADVTVPYCVSDSTTNCEFTNLWVDPINCDADGDGSFDASLYFDYTSVSDSGYLVYVNGEFHSFQTAYPQDSSGIVIDNLAPANGDTICVSIEDLEHSNCSSSTYCFIAPDCLGTTGHCAITNLTAAVSDCDSTTNEFYVTLTFDIENSQNNEYVIQDVIYSSNNINYYYGEYTNEVTQTYVLGPLYSNDKNHTITISDFYRSCSASIDIVAPSKCGYPDSCMVQAEFALVPPIILIGENTNGINFCINEDIIFHNYSDGARYQGNTDSHSAIDYFEWYINDVFVTGEEDLNWTFTQAGNYEIRLVAYGLMAVDSVCFDEQVMDIYISDEPNCNSCDGLANFIIDGDSLICVGDTIHFINNSNQAGGTFGSDWWVNGTFVSSTYDLHHVFTQEGEYEVRLEYYNAGAGNSVEGCTDDYTVIIEVQPAQNCGNEPVCNTQAYFNLAQNWNEPMCAGNTIVFENWSTNADAFTWSIDGQLESHDTHFDYVFPTAGVYEVQLFAENTAIDSCFANYSMTIQLSENSVCDSGACVDTSTCVLPGDADQNGIVNALDLLRVGEGYLTQGSSRPNASTDYHLQSAADWVDAFEDGVNCKHADTNGDGMIDEQDKMAIEQNYTSVPTLTYTSVENANSPQYQYDANNKTRLRTQLVDEYDMPSGERVYDFAVILENREGNPVVNDVYGLGFVVDYSAPVSVAASVQYAANDGSWQSWLGHPEANNTANKLLTIDKNFSHEATETGRLEIAMTRVNQQSLNGAGALCRILCVIAIDDWSRAQTSGKTTDTDPESFEFNLHLNTANVIDEEGSNSYVQGDLLSMTVRPNPAVNLSLNLCLEGAYQTNQHQLMATTANLPLQQPFNSAPWGYTGDEAVVNIPDGVVDWVLVEARSATQPTQVMAQKAAFLMANGEVLDVNGITNGVGFFDLLATESYYIAIRQRNHLAVMSAAPLAAGAELTYDFTQPNQVMGGASQLTLVDADSQTYALKAGDFDGNGIITVHDFNEFTQALESNTFVEEFDLDFNGILSIDDFNLYQQNASSIGVSLIRY